MTKKCLGNRYFHYFNTAMCCMHGLLNFTGLNSGFNQYLIFLITMALIANFKTYIMKKLVISLYLIMTTILFTKCDPDRNTGGTFHFKVKGMVNNTNESIRLGDTLKFEVKIPPIITATNLDGTTRTETVNSLQSAFYGFDIFRVDTINRTVYPNDSTKMKYTINPGYQINGCPTCFTGFAYIQQNPPYNCVLNLIPQVKGVFYFEIIPQQGNFKVNNNFEGLFSVGIDAPDRHYTMLRSYLGASFYNGIPNRDSLGFGAYGFRVN